MEQIKNAIDVIVEYYKVIIEKLIVLLEELGVDASALEGIIAEEGTTLGA